MIATLALTTLTALASRLVSLLAALWSAGLPQLTAAARQPGATSADVVELTVATWNRRVVPLLVARTTTAYERARDDAWIAARRPTITPKLKRDREQAILRHQAETRQRITEAGRHFTDTVRRAFSATPVDGVTPEQLTPTAGRLDRIAQTELHAAYNAGLQDELVALNLPIRKRWLAVNDDRTREAHRLADGQEVALRDDFTVGDAKLPYPGYRHGPPDQVINCRCRTQYVLAVPDSVTAATSSTLCDCDELNADGES